MPLDSLTGQPRRRHPHQPAARNVEKFRRRLLLLLRRSRRIAARRESLEGASGVLLETHRNFYLRQQLIRTGAKLFDLTIDRIGVKLFLFRLQVSQRHALPDVRKFAMKRLQRNRKVLALLQAVNSNP